MGAWKEKDKTVRQGTRRIQAATAEDVYVIYGQCVRDGISYCDRYTALLGCVGAFE